MKSRKGIGVPGLIGIGSILWLGLVFAAYYAGHKPFTPMFAVLVLRSGSHLLAALALVSLAGGVGRRILRKVSDNPLEALGLHTALGAGILSAGFFLIGSTAGATSVISWTTLVLLTVLLFRDIAGWWRSWEGLARAWHEAGGLGRTVAVGCALIVGFSLITALAPALKFDSLVYHLALPLGTVQSGRVEYSASNVYWGMPQLAETLYTWSMLLAVGKGAIPAGTSLGWGIGVVALAGILGTASRRYGSAGWVAVASLLAGSTLALGLGWGYIEWFTILFGWGVLWSLDRWNVTRQLKWVILAGIYAGFALGSKYPSGALIPAGAIILAWKAVQVKPTKSVVTTPLVFVASAFVAASPWLIKNILATGNPLYPFVFPSGAMDAFRLELYQSMPVWGDWRDVFFLPWRATVYGFEAAQGYAASIGPLLLGLALVVPARRWLRRDGEASDLGVAAPLALIGLVIWAIAGRTYGYLIQTRLYMAFMPAFALLAAAGFDLLARVRLPSVRLGRVAGSLVLLALFFNVIQVGLDSLSKGTGHVLTGYQTEQDYLSRNLGEYAEVVEWIRDLPSSARVVMLWEPRGLYCQPICDSDEILDRWQSDLHREGAPAEVLLAWRRRGYSHMLLHKSGERFIREEDTRYTEDQQRGLQDLLAGLPAPVYATDDYTIYPLTP